jgi:hypothetical protein
VTVGEPVGVFCWVRPYPPPKGRRFTQCKEVLPFSAFRPNLRLKSGWNSWCRECCVERTRQWRRQHPEHKLSRPRVVLSKPKCVEWCGVRGAQEPDPCGRRSCKDGRYRRRHPEELRAKERRKYERRRLARTASVTVVRSRSNGVPIRAVSFLVPWTSHANTAKPSVETAARSSSNASAPPINGYPAKSKYHWVTDRDERKCCRECFPQR